MDILRAYKFRIEPTLEQERSMRRIAGSCRFVWNAALARRQSDYAAGLKSSNHHAMCKWLPAMKDNPQTAWLKASPSQTYQVVLKNLAQAYTNFFEKRGKLPVFKRKHGGSGFSFPQGFTLDESNARIKLPKLGWIPYTKTRAVLGEVKNISISCVAGKWFASLQTERQIAAPVARLNEAGEPTSAVGIDAGIKRFASFNDGEHLAPLNSFKTHQARLARYQRRLARKVKFSNNWKKGKVKLQAIHARIANVRKDYLHKATTAISKNHALVCVEALKIKQMSKSAKGSLEKPGKQVAQKRGLNRAILDQGWGEFRRQLAYKLPANGGFLQLVPPQYTSQTCPICKRVDKANRPSQAEFRCVACSYENHADVVAAMNILERGLRLFACGRAGSARGHLISTQPDLLKQEPPDVSVHEVSHV